MSFPFHSIVADALANRLPRRNPEGDKKSHGSALLIAGSKGMAGAALFAAKAAYRVGCGYLRLAAPAGELPVLQVLIPEAVHLPLGSAGAERLEVSAREPLDSAVRLAEAWAIGPGLSCHRETEELVVSLLPEWGGKGVVDADALNAAAGRPELFLRRENCGNCADLILTPHEREWGRLFGHRLPTAPAERRQAVQQRAMELRQTIIAKGAVTIVGLPSGEVWEYDGRCSALAKAGTGDVLTGTLLGLLAQGASTTDAALLAVWLHGRAGAIGASRRTEYGLLASELPDLLPLAIAELLDLPVAEASFQRYH